MPETGSWKPHISLSEDRRAAIFPVPQVSTARWFPQLGFILPGAFVKSRFATEVLAVAWEPAFPADVAVCSQAVETMRRHIVMWFGYHPTALFNCIQIKGYVMMTWTILSKRTKIIEKPAILHSITVI